MPASSAVWIIRTHSSSSVLPHGPNIIDPRQWALTLTPVLPSVRYSMSDVHLQPRALVRFEPNLGYRRNTGGCPDTWLATMAITYPTSSNRRSEERRVG